MHKSWAERKFTQTLEWWCKHTSIVIVKSVMKSSTANIFRYQGITLISHGLRKGLEKFVEYCDKCVESYLFGVIQCWLFPIGLLFGGFYIYSGLSVPCRLWDLGISHIGPLNFLTLFVKWWCYLVIKFVNLQSQLVVEIKAPVLCQEICCGESHYLIN